MWLAESYAYSPDYKELTVKTRSGINWSDGKPFSAEDVAYSLNTLNELGAKVKWGKDVQEVLESATVVDPNTTLLKFKVPGAALLLSTCSPTSTTSACTSSRSISSRARTGRHSRPSTSPRAGRSRPVPGRSSTSRRPRRCSTGATAGGASRPASASCRRSSASCCCPMRASSSSPRASSPTPSTSRPACRSRPSRRCSRATPTSPPSPASELPWGNVDWWPTSLYLNCKRAPFDNPKFRWAISYLIDRQTLIDVGWGGSSSLSPLPMPDGAVYKGLEPYFEVGQAAAREISDQRVQPRQGRRASGRARLEEGRRRAVSGPERQAVHARDHQLLRFPLGRAGAGRAAAPAGHQRHLRPAAGHVRPLLLRRFQRLDLRPRRQRHATLTRRCGSTSRPHRRCPAARPASGQPRPAGTTTTTT